MDNAIILELIKKDIEELKLLVEILEKQPDNKDILIEITTSKAKNLLQEISLLGGKKANEVTDFKKEELIEAAGLKFTEKTDPEPDPHQLIEELIEEYDQAPAATTETSKQPEVQEAEESKLIQEETLSSAGVSTGTNAKEEEQEAPEFQQKEQAPVNTAIADEVSSEINNEIPSTYKTDDQEPPIEEIPDMNEVKQVQLLGEKFTAGKSLNERFTSLQENQYKVKGKPVTSIKKAIGLNDRFMYTRELFNNDTSKFEATVEQLDKATSIIEAVEFLEQNFRWKKDDTSLKFMELVKRRFNN
ncbi:hypothetical protein [Roseimarinus sediminis]|uniref:hypothetical protein n=1 Tax=Roseimarinus sediminis TaxID=1610899 RepID=UPI003D1C4FEF